MIFIDCPPSLELLTLNGLSAAGILGWMVATDFFQKSPVKLPGQNYSSETPATPQAE